MSAVATIERPVKQGSSSPRMPSAGWIWLGSAIGALGLAATIAWGVFGVTGYLNRVNDLVRIPVPGHMTVQIASGEQFVYYEGPRAGSPASLGQLGIRMTDPQGNTVALEPYRLDVRYDAPGNDGLIGHALATFRASGTGAYRVTATGTAPAGSRIAVGQSVAKNVIPTVLGIIALLLVTVGGGLALIVMTLVRRSSVRRGAARL